MKTIGANHSTAQLLVDISKFGLPEISFYFHGANIKFTPKIYSLDSGKIRFYDSVETQCHIELDTTYLVEKLRPDNIVVRCRQCYDLHQARTDKYLFTLFWPEE